MPQTLSRRELIEKSALAAGMAALGGVWSDRAAAQSKSPNEKLNVAWIGCGGKGDSDISSIMASGMASIVALCDVDDRQSGGAYGRHPDVPKYKDFRRMLDKEGKRIDAVGVSTPDHMHAPAAMMAIRMGKHVYVQKPLTHTIDEARALAVEARKRKLVTQMGNQGHPSYWRLVETMRTGVIGQVTEVHVMTDRPIWPQGMASLPAVETVPAKLDWDLWLGVAPKREYNHAYLPFVWRGWWDYGTGALGDMACHIMDGAFLSLDLKYPTAAWAESDTVQPDACPNWEVVHLQFPARGDKPPVTLHWYDGGKTIPEDLLEGQKIDKGYNGSLFIGTKGKILMGHGAAPVLLPEKQFEDWTPPTPYLPRPEGPGEPHYTEWVRNCIKGGVCGSNFDYSGPMTEAILLGNVAVRLGKRLEWDAAAMKATNCPEADQYVRHHYRRGWRL